MANYIMYYRMDRTRAERGETKVVCGPQTKAGHCKTLLPPPRPTFSPHSPILCPLRIKYPNSFNAFIQTRRTIPERKD